ncbi:MAG: long-chain-fatty-acid--CoA ligase [Planctomycetota bacterium]|nr:MAG: long-chain-fatty-acid--CoA ligase [Planctomycetota bacterium]
MAAHHLSALLREQARLRPDAVALRCGERDTTYAALLRRSLEVASGLCAAGVGAGARVACIDKDAEGVFELLFGCAHVGAVWVGLNWRLTARELRYMLEDSEARALFAGPEFAEKAREAASGLALQQLALRDGAWDAWLARHAPLADERALDAEEVAVQLYTSGTTGNPKGVLLAHRSFFAVIDALRRHGDAWIGWSERDVVLHDIPSFHIGGLWWAMVALQHGAKLVVLEMFTGWQVLEAIERERVTKACMVPAMIQTCLDEPACARTDFRSLGHLVYGGSPIPEPLLRRAMAAFGCAFAQIYGLTETGNTAVCLRPADHASARAELVKAAGRPYPDVRIEIVDRDGRALPPRAVGEIRIHSPANMLGYWKNPTASASTLRDGWIHTGDAGYLDEEGYVYVCDRVKDMIISAGENIYPAEIESVLAAHPALREVAVIGVPHERWGEEVKAIAVLRDGERATARELVAFARGKLADFKLPRSVDFVERLPRTPSGKIKKAELRAPFWSGRERQVN